MKIGIINGPNLNLLGKREVDIYGGESFESFLLEMKNEFSGHEFEYIQSNIEGELIDAIQQLGFSCDGLIINPGGYTHTSVAIGDAIAAIPSPVIEVHISNIFARESFRQVSHVSAAKSRGVISGLGLQGYKQAINYFLSSIPSR
jgi:3-dehydroquinate dehydratase II